MLSLIKVVKFDYLISFTDCYIILKYLIVLYLEESFMNFNYQHAVSGVKKYCHSIVVGYAMLS